MPTLPRTAREVQLAALPEGLPTPEHFAVVPTPLPVPENGELLVRNRFFHVFPALRTLIGGGLPGAPFPPLRPGDTLYGAAIGEIVSAPPGAGPREVSRVRIILRPDRGVRMDPGHLRGDLAVDLVVVLPAEQSVIDPRRRRDRDVDALGNRVIGHA